MTTTDTLISMIRERHAAGLVKYGVTVDRKDLTPEQWLHHSIEERIDDLKYMMRAAQEIAALRQMCDDWKRCAEMFKEVSLMERYPEIGDNCESLRNNADQLFSILSGKFSNDHHNPNP